MQRSAITRSLFHFLAGGRRTKKKKWRVDLKSGGRRIRTEFVAGHRREEGVLGDDGRQRIVERPRLHAGSLEGRLAAHLHQDDRHQKVHLDPSGKPKVSFIFVWFVLFVFFASHSQPWLNAPGRTLPSAHL